MENSIHELWEWISEEKAEFLWGSEDYAAKVKRRRKIIKLQRIKFRMEQLQKKTFKERGHI